MPIRNGRNFTSSRTGWTSSIRGSRRRHGKVSTGGRGIGQRRGRQLLQGHLAGCLRGLLAHVASPASASVRRVRSSTSRSATGLSISVIVQRAGRRRGGHGHRREAEEAADRALLEVDGLHPRHGSDPSLPRQPAGLRVDGRVGALPAVDAVAHPRHPHDVGDRHDGVRRPHPDRHREPVEDPSEHQHHQQDQRAQSPRRSPTAPAPSSRPGGRARAAPGSPGAGARVGESAGIGRRVGGASVTAPDCHLACHYHRHGC